MDRETDGSRTIWIVRHGESTWNVRGLIQGHADGPVLTETGHRQAALLAERFRQGRIEALYASDLLRARQTAAHIAAAVALPIHCDAALRERCFGVYEGLPLSALERGASGIHDDHVVDPSAAPHGGESLLDVSRRVAGFVGRLTRRRHGGDVVVVTHGGTMRIMRAYGSGVSLANLKWGVIPNAGVWSLYPPAPAPDVVPNEKTEEICVPQP